MDDIRTLGLYAAMLALPAIGGPVAAVIYIQALKRDVRWLVPFWIALLVWHVVSSGLTFWALNGLEVLGLLSCLMTPILAVVAMLILRFSSRPFYQAVGDDNVRRRWFLVGTISIPLLQVGVLTLLVLFAPMLDAMLLGLGHGW